MRQADALVHRYDQRLVPQPDVPLKTAQGIADAMRRSGDVVEHAKLAQIELRGQGQAEEVVADGARGQLEELDLRPDIDATRRDRGRRQTNRRGRAKVQDRCRDD